MEILAAADTEPGTRARYEMELGRARWDAGERPAAIEGMRTALEHARGAKTPDPARVAEIEAWLAAHGSP